MPACAHQAARVENDPVDRRKEAFCSTPTHEACVRLTWMHSLDNREDAVADEADRACEVRELNLLRQGGGEATLRRSKIANDCRHLRQDKRASGREVDIAVRCDGEKE